MIACQRKMRKLHVDCRPPAQYSLARPISTNSPMRSATSARCETLGHLIAIRAAPQAVPQQRWPPTSLTLRSARTPEALCVCLQPTAVSLESSRPTVWFPFAASFPWPSPSIIVGRSPGPLTMRLSCSINSRAMTSWTLPVFNTPKKTTSLHCNSRYPVSASAFRARRFSIRSMKILRVL